MSARFSRRFLSLRVASASSRTNVAAATGRALARRGMASEAHGAHKSGGSDLTWMVGSAVVFLPLCGYLLSPAARSKGHHVNEKIGQTDEAHKTKSEPEPEPVHTDDEGTKKSAAEVKDSLTRSEETDAPKEAHDAEAREVKDEPEASTEATEGTESTPSSTPSPSTTSPDPYTTGSPSQSSASQSSPVEQKSPPTDRAAHKGTVQSDGDDVPKPTEMGEARKEARKGSVPKEAKEGGEGGEGKGKDE